MAVNKSLRVVCNDQAHDAVEAMARASGQSRSAVVGRLLEQIAPQLVELAGVMEAAKRGPDRVASAVSNGLSEFARAVREGAEVDSLTVKH